MMKRIHIFKNVPFNTCSKNELLSFIVSCCKQKKKTKIFNMNVQGVVEYKKNSAYSQAINSAEVIYPDGWGPVLASRVNKNKLKKRVNVGDFIDELLENVEENKFKLYLLGCEESTVKATVDVLKLQHKKLSIVGYHSGFFTKKEEKNILQELRNLKPNLVLVGMGLPQQELWISRCYEQLPPAVYMGIGGVFYYISGIKSRAPKLIRNYGFEWFYRLLQEPNRLWKRYTISNIFFGFYFLQSIFAKYIQTTNGGK